MHSSSCVSNTSSLDASEPLHPATTPRAGKFLRTQVQYQLHTRGSSAVPFSGNSSLLKTPHPVIVSSPTPISRQPSNYRQGAGSIFPNNLKSITSAFTSEARLPFSFSAAAASTTASQLSTITIAGPVFSSSSPRSTWQQLEVDSMTDTIHSAHKLESPGALSKRTHFVSLQRQRQLEGAGGVAPRSSTTARECIVEARRIVQHFVNSSCSEAAFYSVIERSAGHERWALLRVLKELLSNAAKSEEHRESLLLVRGYRLFIRLIFQVSYTRACICRKSLRKSRRASR
jgi:hypothetical protein